jgi:hypothetical protein
MTISVAETIGPQRFSHSPDSLVNRRQQADCVAEASTILLAQSIRHPTSDRILNCLELEQCHNCHLYKKIN